MHLLTKQGCAPHKTIFRENETSKSNYSLLSHYKKKTGLFLQTQELRTGTAQQLINCIAAITIISQPAVCASVCATSGVEISQVRNMTVLQRYSVRKYAYNSVNTIFVRVIAEFKSHIQTDMSAL